jgi:predicted lipoprotein with Yx(FWY)xxD motif
MQFVSKVTSPRRRRLGALVGGAVLSIGAVSGVLPSLGASASATARKAPPVLQEMSVAKYPGVLGNSKSHSLYLLHDELGGKLHCTGECLQFWFPLYVAKGSHPSIGAGVKGKLGTVARKLSKKVTRYQLTFNSYPVYTFSGDTGPKQSHGEHVKFAAGVFWYLLRASATTAAKTPVTQATVPASVLEDINVPSYPGVLGNSKQFSLYVLQDEVGGKLHCTGGCLSFWFPMYVAKGSHPSIGAGVKGKLGTVARKLSSTVTKYQLTYNSYPVYVYSGDTGSKQSNGEGIMFSAGVYWYLASASATTAAATPVLPTQGY